MMNAEGLSYPSLPTALLEKYAVGKPKFRPFGTEESDLSLDFAAANIPALVTQVLAQCSTDGEKRLPDDFLKDLTVGKRLECLLNLAAGGAKSAFFFAFKCGACGQDLEFELMLDEIAAMQAEADALETVVINFENQTAVFRKPNARDQDGWRAAESDGIGAAQVMIRSLQIAPDDVLKLREEDYKRLADAMDEADPLINFSCRVRCADCGAANDFPIDLCEFALGELGRAQQFLIRAVHRLATRYHWSEKEIFAVPHWRRLKYLALIADEKTR